MVGCFPLGNPNNSVGMPLVGIRLIENVKLIIDSENQNKNLNHGTYTDEHLMKHLKNIQCLSNVDLAVKFFF